MKIIDKKKMLLILDSFLGRKCPLKFSYNKPEMMFTPLSEAQDQIIFFQHFHRVILGRQHFYDCPKVVFGNLKHGLKLEFYCTLQWDLNVRDSNVLASH